MRLFTSALGLAAMTPLSLAGPLLQGRDEQAMRVMFQVEKATSQAAITASNQQRTEIFGQACSTTLQSGVFADHPITFDTDQEGQGTVTLGTQKYTIHSSPEISGGISCGSFDSASELLITCDVAVPVTLKLRSLAKRNLAACFPKEMQLEAALAGFERGATAPPVFSEADQSLNMTDAEISAMASDARTSDMALPKRQLVCQWSATTRMVGNGNPHQNPYHTQLSGNLNCGNGRCFISQSAITATTIEFRISPGARLTSWLSGGFRVERSHYTGNSYGCVGERFETICVWDRIDQTAYTVENGLANTCGNNWLQHGDPFVLWSPNIGSGPNYYCVRGERYCRSLGQGWLDTDPGTPGGPR